MKTTVLLAVRNGGALLHEAVASVLAQTASDFELLLVDDASDDGATDRLPGDERIRVLRNESNLGQIPSLNLGLRAALGEYVARLDHDDVCLPRRLELQAAALDADPELALVGAWTDIVEDGRLWGRVRGSFGSRAEFAARLIVDDVPLTHPSIMFRREHVLALGGYRESLGAAEDKDLYRRLALARGRAEIVPETLVRYRRHEGQMTVTRAAAVREHDHVSQDAFLAALDPDAPLPQLRRLLAGDPEYWSGVAVEADELERFLERAAARLGVESGELAPPVAARLAGAVLAGWASGGGAYRTGAPRVAAFAARYGGPRARAASGLSRVLVPTAFVGSAVGALRPPLRRVLHSERLASARARARRSRALRWVYTRVAGSRLADD